MKIQPLARDKKSRLRRGTSVGSMALATVLVLASVTPAHADYYSGGMPSAYFNYKAVSVNSTWKGYFNAAAARWTQSAAQTAIGAVTSSRNTMTAASYSQSWYGYYTPYGTRGTRSFKIQVNVRTLSNAAGSNLTKWIASTATHELGHALSLADNPNTTRASLMKHSRNRTTLIAPTSYDVSEVNRIY